MKILLVNAENFFCDSIYSISVLPETAIVRPGTPFFIPDNENRWGLNFGIGAVITRLGKSIEEQFACRYWEKALFTARAIPQNNEQGTTLPPLGFDGSILTGTIDPHATCLNIITATLPKAGHPSTITEETTINVTECSPIINRCIALTSRYFSLHTGDIVMFDPISNETVATVPDTRITAMAGSEVILTHKIK